MFKVDWPGHRWPIGHLCRTESQRKKSGILVLYTQGVPHLIQPHGPEVWCSPGQVGGFLTTISSSSVESLSLWHWWVGDMSMPQLWQGSTLSWSLVGDTRREDCADDFLNFSGEEASLWDLPLWIFKPFSVLKLDSQWSHGKASSCVTIFSEAFWLDSKPVVEAAGWDFFIRNSCLRLAFLLRADGLFLLLADMVSLPSLESKEKEKVEPMERENLNILPWMASAWQKSMHLVAKEVSSPLEGAAIVESYFWTMKIWRPVDLTCFHSFNIKSTHKDTDNNEGDEWWYWTQTGTLIKFIWLAALISFSFSMVMNDDDDDWWQCLWWLLMVDSNFVLLTVSQLFFWFFLLNLPNLHCCFLSLILFLWLFWQFYNLPIQPITSKQDSRCVARLPGQTSQILFTKQM